MLGVSEGLLLGVENPDQAPPAGFGPPLFPVDACPPNIEPACPVPAPPPNKGCCEGAEVVVAPPNREDDEEVVGAVPAVPKMDVPDAAVFGALDPNRPLDGLLVEVVEPKRLGPPLLVAGVPKEKVELDFGGLDIMANEELKLLRIKLRV